ncbi:MAG: hypothetical protein PHW76_01550 [Alphaproteobacteria bacterium]|nr:hypothetical protein [Alphaproteobacteria bacterium]
MNNSKNFNLHSIASLSPEDLKNKIFDNNELQLLTVSSSALTSLRKKGASITSDEGKLITEACNLLHIYAALWCILRLPPPEYSSTYHVDMSYKGGDAFNRAKKDFDNLQTLRSEICSNAKSQALSAAKQETMQQVGQYAPKSEAVVSDEYPRTEAQIMAHLSGPGRALFDLVKKIEEIRYPNGNPKFPTFLRNLKDAVFPVCDFIESCFDVSDLARTDKERQAYKDAAEKAQRLAAEAKALAEQKERDEKLAAREKIDWREQAKGPAAEFAELLIHPNDSTNRIRSNQMYKEAAVATQMALLIFLQLGDPANLVKTPSLIMQWKSDETLNYLDKTLKCLTASTKNLAMVLSDPRETQNIIRTTTSILEIHLNYLEDYNLCPQTVADMRLIVNDALGAFKVKQAEQAKLKERPFEDRAFLLTPANFLGTLIDPQDLPDAYEDPNVERLGKTFQTFLIANALFNTDPKEHLLDVEPIFRHGRNLYDQKHEDAYDGMVALLDEYDGRETAMPTTERQKVLDDAIDAVVECLEETETASPETAKQIRAILAPYAEKRAKAIEVELAELREAPMEKIALLKHKKFMDVILSPEDSKTALRDPLVENLGKSYHILMIAKLINKGRLTTDALVDYFDEHPNELYSPAVEREWESMVALLHDYYGQKIPEKTKLEHLDIIRTNTAYRLDLAEKSCPSTAEKISADLLRRGNKKPGVTSGHTLAA